MKKSYGVQVLVHIFIGNVYLGLDSDLLRNYDIDRIIDIGQTPIPFKPPVKWDKVSDASSLDVIINQALVNGPNVLIVSYKSQTSMDDITDVVKALGEYLHRLDLELTEDQLTQLIKSGLHL